VWGSLLSGATLTFETAGNATVVDGPVAASATFTTSAGALDITLQNDLANPSGVGQLLSSLWFTLSGGATASLNGSSGTLITVNKDKTYNGPGSPVATAWVFQTSGTSLVVCVICPGGNAPVAPAHVIIGAPAADNTYASAGGSIAGNGPHNPFIFQTATFHLVDSSISANTLVGGVVFGLGTAGTQYVPGIPDQNDTPGVPEPATFLMAGPLLFGGYLLHRRCR
jgi:hypothetical protein